MEGDDAWGTSPPRARLLANDKYIAVMDMHKTPTIKITRFCVLLCCVYFVYLGTLARACTHTHTHISLNREIQTFFLSWTNWYLAHFCSSSRGSFTFCSCSFASIFQEAPNCLATWRPATMVTWPLLMTSRSDNHWFKRWSRPAKEECASPSWVAKVFSSKVSFFLSSLQKFQEALLWGVAQDLLDETSISPGSLGVEGYSF